MTLFTLGYEGMTVPQFLSLLNHHQIESLVDVRALPLSRKPGFSKTALRDLLKNAGITYFHAQKLGCPKPIRDHYKTDNNWSRYFHDFGAYLKTQTAAIRELSSLVVDSRCVLMCFEANFARCHRSIVADAVCKLTNDKIHHLKIEAELYLPESVAV